jgi:intracellular multiplication protein IcmE
MSLVALKVLQLSGEVLCHLKLHIELKPFVHHIKAEICRCTGICACGQQIIMENGQLEAWSAGQPVPDSEVVVTLVRRAIDPNLNAEELVANGFCVSCLKSAGVQAHQLRLAGFDVKQLRDAGFTACELRCAGFSPYHLRAVARFGPAALRSAGLRDRAPRRNYRFEFDKKKALKDASLDACQRRRWFNAHQLKGAGFSLHQLQGAGFDAKQLKDAGFHAHQLVKIFDLDRLKDAGFSADQLRDAECDAHLLRDVGFNANQLKIAGFEACRMRGVFSLDELMHAGFNASQLLDAGFDGNQLKVASIGARQLRKTITFQHEMSSCP